VYLVVLVYVMPVRCLGVTTPTRCFAHASNGKPIGGNQCYADGSVRWVKFQQMYFIHSWNPGGRQYYIYQEDLGDIKNPIRARL